jgi:hypothetical protein
MISENSSRADRSIPDSRAARTGDSKEQKAATEAASEATEVKGQEADDEDGTTAEFLDDDSVLLGGEEKAATDKKSIFQKAKNWVNENITGEEDNPLEFTSEGLSKDAKLQIGAAAAGVAGAALLSGCSEGSGSYEHGRMTWQTHDINDPKVVGFSHSSYADYDYEVVGRDDYGRDIEERELRGYDHSYQPRIKNTKVGEYEKPKYLPPKRDFMGPKVPRDKEVTLEWEEPVMSKRKIGNKPTNFYERVWWGGWGWNTGSDPNSYEFDNNGNLVSASNGISPVYRNAPEFNADGSVKMKDVEKTFMVDEGCKGLNEASNLAQTLVLGGLTGLLMGTMLTTGGKVISREFMEDNSEEQLELLEEVYAETQEAIKEKEESKAEKTDETTETRETKDTTEKETEESAA